VARLEEERKMYRVSMGKPEGKRPLERPRRRWKNGIRTDLGESGCRGVSSLLRIRADGCLVNTVVNLRVLAPRT